MKAILVFDEMPNSCGECPLKHLEERWMCNLTDKIVSIDCEKPKPTWCPLRPLPSFKAVDLNDTRDVLMFCHGWNTCLADITGETDWQEQYLMLR